MQLGVQPEFVTTQMLASVRMSEWELTHKLELLLEVLLHKLYYADVGSPLEKSVAVHPNSDSICEPVWR
jgi:hypothetical protein